jgi:hypothetical protein
MSTKDNDVNRTIDGDTAEGHKRFLVEDAEDKRAGKRADKRTEKTSHLDDEAEGHRRQP